MAWSRFRDISDEAIVIGLPPRSLRWRMQDHLDPLLTAVEEANFRVRRGVLAFRGPKNHEGLFLTDQSAADDFRGKPVIIIDNLWKTGHTAMSVAHKLARNVAAGAHFCVMSRWIADNTQAIALAKEYRTAVCGSLEGLYSWYRDVYCAPSASE